MLCKLRETKPPSTKKSTCPRHLVFLLACSCSAQLPPCVVFPAGGGGDEAEGASPPLPVAPVRAPVNPSKSCLPASAIWLVKSLTPDATEPFPVIPKLLPRSPVKSGARKKKQRESVRFHFIPKRLPRTHC